MSDISKLYDPVIKAHNAQPFHFQKLENAENTIEASNSICGDTFEVYFEQDTNKLLSLHFYGHGCAVSTAAASVLCKTLTGKTLDEALGLCQGYLSLIQKRNAAAIVPSEFHAFEAVAEFPERYDCAALVWEEMRNFLQSLLNQ